jgi:hypothetical protein
VYRSSITLCCIAMMLHPLRTFGNGAAYDPAEDQRRRPRPRYNRLAGTRF